MTWNNKELPDKRETISTVDKTEYDSLVDVMADPNFFEADSKLRAGENIIPQQNDLYSFVVNARPHLTDYFASVYQTLRCTQEGAFYNQMQRRTNAPTRRFDELTMVIGLIIVQMKLDLTPLDGNHWVEVDQLMDTMTQRIPEQRLAKLFHRRGINQTAFDLTKMRTELDKRLRDLKSKGFIMLGRGNQTFQATIAIYRFIEPLRGLSDQSEINDSVTALIKEGYLLSLDQADNTNEYQNNNLNDSQNINNNDSFSIGKIC